MLEKKKKKNLLMGRKKENLLQNTKKSNLKFISNIDIS